MFLVAGVIPFASMCWPPSATQSCFRFRIENIFLDSPATVTAKQSKFLLKHLKKAIIHDNDEHDDV